MNTAVTTPSLAEQLGEIKAGSAKRLPPERLAVMTGAIDSLRASGIESTALKVGALAPDVTLNDATGQPVALKSLWQEGPLVIAFYRGGWCPYCNLELRAWQQRLGELKTHGATLVAISPQTPDNSLSTQQKNELAFGVLSDSAMLAAKGFGIVFTLPPDLVMVYEGFGNQLPEVNGNGQWVLPIPATYVVGNDGRIAYAHVESDYRERAEPAEAMAVVAKLAAH